MEIGCCVSVSNLEKLPECGFNFVELPGRELAKLGKSDIAAIRKRLEIRNLACKSLNAYCPENLIIAGPGQNLREAGRYAKRLAEYASELSVSQIGIGAPRSRSLPYGYDREDAGRQLREFLRCTADEFAVYGIYVSLEAVGACYCNYINCLRDAAEIIEDTGHPFLRLVPDYYNMEQSDEADMDLGAYMPLIAHIHISDDEGDPGKRGFLKPEKYGVHQKRLVQLKEIGYEGTVSLEVDCGPDCPECIQSCLFLKKVLCS